MKTRLSPVLVAVLCVVLTVIPRDMAAADLGEPGLSGANGDTPSGDGEPGTNGGDASDVQLNGDPQTFALAFGGNGGDGGNGGIGTIIPIFSPQGGNGGVAGNAGSANAVAGGVKSVVGSVDVIANAMGGFGGFGGIGGGGEPAGGDGAGGDAGDATAVARVSRSGEGPTMLTVSAEGGRGGTGDGGASGMSGNANAHAELTSTAGGKQTVSLVSLGGAASGGPRPGGPGGARASSLIDVHGELSLDVNVAGGLRGSGLLSDTIDGSAQYEGEIRTELGPITARYTLKGHSASLIDVATSGGNLEVLGTLTSLTGSNTDKSPGGGSLAQAVYAAAGNAKVDFTLLGGGGGAHTDPETLEHESGAGGSSGMNLVVNAGGQIHAAVSVLGGTGSSGGVGSIGGDFRSEGRADVSVAAIGGHSVQGSGANANVGIRVESATTTSAQVQTRGGSGTPGGTATSSLIATAPGIVGASGSATGGHSGIGHRGGTANLSILGISTDGGEVFATGEALGGGGGGGSSEAGVNTNGGQGGDVSLFNGVRGDTTGQLTITQNAYGGSGGASSFTTPGSGGNATSELSILEHASSLATINAGAVGGPGGAGSTTGGAIGGLARSIAQSQTENGRLRVNSNAIGGLGGSSGGGAGGQGGFAIAFARGAAIGNGQQLEIASRATGGNGNTGMNDSRFGAGGNAQSEAVGTSTGNSTFTVHAFADGGTGISGGNAQATAKSINEGVGHSPALALATGGNSIFADGLGGNAFAEAIAERRGPAGDAIASAEAKAGRRGRAFARATAIGPSGTASAMSTTPGLLAIASAPVGSTSIAETQTGFSVPAPAPTTPGLTSFVYVTADPLNSDVLGALAGNATAHEDFDVGGASQMLAMVSMGASYPLDGNGAFKTMGTTFTQTLDLTGVTVLQDLMVALVNPEVTGSFISLRFNLAFGGTPLINQTFTDADTMNAFFGDRSLNLGALSPEAQGRTLSVSFDFASRTPGSGFSTQLAYGNSTPGIGPTVPEPAAWILLAIARFLCPNPRIRRRRRSLPLGLAETHPFPAQWWIPGWVPLLVV